MRINQYFLIPVFVIFFCTGCYKEEIIPVERHDFIDFYMEDKQLELIQISRNEKFEINNPKPLLLYNEEYHTITEFKLRGRSALRYRRKSFNVEILDSITTFHSKTIQLKDFRLLSLTADYTYIENYLSYNFLKRINLMPTFFQYIEVKINNQTQGLYILIENPEYYVLKKKNADIIIRRSYDGGIDNYNYNEYAKYPAEMYLSKFNEIYDNIIKFNGKQLYDSLNNLFNIKNYYRKMAFDYLISNGDYTDEIYFYTIQADSIYFDILPWDYDDIFSDKPHEIGNDWAIGKAFGVRIYKSIEDVINDVGNKLIYSIEDDLDYTIAKDSFLYEMYLKELKWTMEQLNLNVIDSIFRKTDNEIKPFFEDEKIIEQSIYDKDPSNIAEYKNNIEDKKKFIINRRKEILENLTLY